MRTTKQLVTISALYLTQLRHHVTTIVRQEFPEVIQILMKINLVNHMEIIPNKFDQNKVDKVQPLIGMQRGIV